MVFDEQLLVDSIDDERVLHKTDVIMEVNRIVKKLVKAIGDTEIDCTKFDDYCSMEVAGLGLSPKVSKIIEGGTWCWPPDWMSNYPNLANIIVSNIFVARDCLVWRHNTHGDADFLVAKAWVCIRPRADKVWNHFKSFTVIPNIPSDLNSFMDFLIPLVKMRSARSVVSKLVLAASSYFIWQERNSSSL
nr:hypothetical protein [Tanacetum cinerariifolium]